MLIRETRSELMSMLAAAGVPPGGVPAPVTLLQVFRRFAAIPVRDAEPVEDDGDGVLAQYGTSSLRGPRAFSVDLTRQLAELDPLAADPGLWQLSCTLSWPPTPETEALGDRNGWSFGRRPEAFFADVATQPGWRWALGTPTPPQGFSVVLSEV